MGIGRRVRVWKCSKPWLPEGVNWLEKVWQSWPASLILGLVSAGFAVWAIWVTPSPGTSIAILGAVAALMSVRPEMRPLEKAGWLIIITVLLVAEVHSIRKNDKDVSSERTAQQETLKALNDKATSITNELKTALNDVDKTLKQTQPRAAIRFDMFEFNGQPSKIDANVSYGFDWYFTNIGSETAEDIDALARIYVGKADDKPAQIQLQRRFEEEWKSATPFRLGKLVPGNTPAYQSINRTFENSQVKELNEGGTIYLFVRFEYSDDVGRLRTDACSSLQRSGTEIDLRVLHSCLVFDNFRYPIKQRNDIQR
jgi:hypothetical protein